MLDHDATGGIPPPRLVRHPREGSQEGSVAAQARAQHVAVEGDDGEPLPCVLRVCEEACGPRPGRRREAEVVLALHAKRLGEGVEVGGESGFALEQPFTDLGAVDSRQTELVVVLIEEVDERVVTQLPDLPRLQLHPEEVELEAPADVLGVEEVADRSDGGRASVEPCELGLMEVDERVVPVDVEGEVVFADGDVLVDVSVEVGDEPLPWVLAQHGLSLELGPMVRVSRQRRDDRDLGLQHARDASEAR